MDTISSILGLVSSVINRIWPDKTEAEKAKFLLEFQKILSESDIAKAQLQVNANEAQHSNLFVAGWRPCVGWVCALAFAWAYFLCPILTFLIVVAGHPVPNMPTLGLDQMMPVLFGMLGLGAYRTYEKVQNGKK